MTREELIQETQTFVALLRREQEIKEELLSLKMGGHHLTEEAIQQKMAYHDGLIAEIQRIRFEEMLPIFERLAQFIAATNPADGN